MQARAHHGCAAAGSLCAATVRRRLFRALPLSPGRSEAVARHLFKPFEEAF